MIAGLISDDYYFCFEEEDIKELEFKWKIYGLFYQPSNTKKGKAKVGKLKIQIHSKPSKEILSAQLEFLDKSKVKALHLLEREFKELLLKPSDAVLEFGGTGIRSGSSNTFFLQPKSKLFEPTKSHISRLIDVAKNGL